MFCCTFILRSPKIALRSSVLSLSTFIKCNVILNKSYIYIFNKYNYKLFLFSCFRSRKNKPKTKWNHLFPSRMFYDEELEQSDRFYQRQPLIMQLCYALYNMLVAHSEMVCYLVIIINHMVSASCATLVLPITIFLWAMLSVPRPSKRYWMTAIIYTEVRSHMEKHPLLEMGKECAFVFIANGWYFILWKSSGLNCICWPQWKTQRSESTESL